MSQTLRQTNLLFAEDWRKIYQAITQVNFQAADFDTYRESVIDYLRIQYPEAYNDWIENDEFVFIMDTFCWLATSYNFRVEQAVRDNFMGLSERRQSILNLASFLNYSPSRNVAAKGLVKIVQIETDEPVQDIDGSSLQNISIDWNDETNPDWFDQFILIMNSVFVSTNPFGTPVKAGTITGVPTQMYQLDSQKKTNVAYPFTARVQGTNTTFEIVNPQFDTFIYERTPNPSDSMNVLYRNDGTGNGSVNTGFFMMFKQGSLQYIDDLFSTAVANREVSVPYSGINDEDVWVQEIDSAGTVITEFTKVPTTENIAYNSIGKVTRTIYEIKTLDQDKIVIRYPDGRFGDAPVGLFRTWFRTSNGLTYTIRAQDIRNTDITIPYIKGSNTYYLRVRFSLQVPVSNSAPAETTEQIRERAPQVHYTQQRMVTGEDYNIYPLRQGSNVLKIKTVNRTYAGHSRFIDRNDPTGTYQNVKMTSDDGMVYRNLYLKAISENLPSAKANTEIVRSRILPLLESKDLLNFYYSQVQTSSWVSSSNRVLWVPNTGSTFSSTGKFFTDSDGNGSADSGTALAVPTDMKSGALIEFVNAASGSFTLSKWVLVETIQNTGQTDLDSGAGPIELNESLGTGWYVNQYYPAFNIDVSDSVIDQAGSQMDSGGTYGLRYSKATGTWSLVLEANLNSEDIDGDSDFSTFDETDGSTNWFILVYYNSGSSWDIYARYLGYVFESSSDVRFFLGADKQVDPETGAAVQDRIQILRINENLESTSNDPDPLDPILGETLEFTLTDPVRYPDGFIEPRRVFMTMTDSDVDGSPDNPQLFEQLVQLPSTVSTSAHRFLFFKKSVSSDGYEYFDHFEGVSVVSTPGAKIGSGYEYTISTDELFYDNGLVQANCLKTGEEGDFYAREGRKDLIFKWVHYANTDVRIDPSPTNIHDVIVLTTNYYNSVQTWLSTSGRTLDTFPVPESSEELNQSFDNIRHAKTMSDTVVYRPAKFKILFGPEASEELQATIKIVKVPGTSTTDNEIKLKVIETLNSFFDVNLWSFGEQFSFSECAAVIHQALPGVVGMCVIVPNKITNKFGNLYQIRSESDELFLSTATVANVQIVQSLTDANINIGS